jgi:hypothetical protein
LESELELNQAGLDPRHSDLSSLPERIESYLFGALVFQRQPALVVIQPPLVSLQEFLNLAEIGSGLFEPTLTRRFSDFRVIETAACVSSDTS